MQLKLLANIDAIAKDVRGSILKFNAAAAVQTLKRHKVTLASYRTLIFAVSADRR